MGYRQTPVVRELRNVDFAYHNPELEQAIRDARGIDDLEAVLRRVSDLVPSLLVPEVRGHMTFCPGLDAAISALPRRLNLPDVPLEKSNDNVCIVATRFYPTGGHSKVASDICQLIGPERVTLVFTDTARTLKPRQLIGGLPKDHPARALLLLNAGTLVEKIIELYMLLAAIQPTRIILIQNHMDMVAVAGVWPFRSVVEFIHHADYLPTLGASLAFSAHVDLTHASHRACRAAGLHPAWAGMTVEAGAAPPEPRPLDPSRPLRIATCGSAHKYLHKAQNRWSDFVIAALAGTSSEMIHIGPKTEELVASVHGPLAAAGIAPQRYRFVGARPSLRQALLDEETDVYLASYPDTGGKANLDALAAGLAPIAPTTLDLGALQQFDLPLAYWVRVTTPAEIPAAIARSLELSAELRTPRGRQAVRDEFSRFETYVRAGEAAAS